jgi:hypothetical protein
MSNKTQLQTNNTKYASLIETLRGKAAGGSGEDVTAETNAYTEKLTQLESAITALETELEGKTSGGGSVTTATVTLHSVHPSRLLYYVDSSGVQLSTQSQSTVICTVPSILAVQSFSSDDCTTSGSISILEETSQIIIFAVTGNSTITLRTYSGGGV